MPNNENMLNNRDKTEEVLRRYNHAGGHVEWTAEEYPDPIQAEAAGASLVPKIISWMHEHELTTIGAEVISGHQPIKNWEMKPSGGIELLPTAYYGFAAWKSYGYDQ